MKKFTFIFLLSCMAMLNNSFAFPTVRQVMNFEVGDIFHYKITKDTAWNQTGYYIESREVVSKEYNLDSTAISYIFKVTSYTGASANGNWCNMKTDSLLEIYSNLDSSCTTLYASYIMVNSLPLDVSTFAFTEEVNSIYNGRTLGKGKKDLYNYLTCGEGLGFINYTAYNGLGNKKDLMWYKKGNETYGTAIAQLQTPTDPYSTLLTRGEVFDFAVGDVIQYQVYDKEDYFGGSAAMSYNKTYNVENRILTKNQIADTLIYIVQRKQQWVAGDTMGFYFMQDTITLKYGGVNDYVGEPCKMSVKYECDSTLSNTVDNIYTASSSSTKYIKGVGSFYWHRNNALYSSYYGETPLYWFKAVQNKSCGSYFTFDSIYVDSLLRRSEVFDFAEGDVFQFERYEKSGNNDSSTYMVEHKILAKTETNNVWTYKILQTQQLSGASDVGAYAEVDTIEEIYDRLEDFVAPVANIFTEKYNVCEPILANEYKTFPSSYSFKISDLYVKGLGVYHNSLKLPNKDSILSEKLSYYHKANKNSTCGTYFNFRYSESILPTEFFVYYISTDDIIKVKFPANELVSVIEIINFEGQTVYKGEVAPKETGINISAKTLNNQLYIVRLLVGDKQYYKKILLAK